MKQTFLCFLCVFLVFSCGKQGLEFSRGDVLVKVKDKVLTREDIERQIPKGLYPADSLMRSENLVRKWIVDVLMDDAAYHNIGDYKAEIEQLVDDYRRSLVRHRYQERIISDRVSGDISEADKIAYYDEYKEQFLLDGNLIKGLFLKVPVDAPGLDNVRSWYTSESEDALERVEKYSLQNAIIYDYFHDRWVTFDEIMAKIPQKLSDPTQYLRLNNRMEVSDSTYVYFLNISDKLMSGSLAPFDYVEAQIQSVLVNKRKIGYLRDFEDNLYRDAVKSGTVKFVEDNVVN